jgi:hypothetical protein
MTIRQLPEPCWVLRPDPWQDGSNPHYATRAEALEILAFLLKLREGDPEEAARLEGAQACQEDGRCWVAECDAPDGPEGTCGETLGDDEEGPSCVCFETLEELLAWLPGEGWTRSGPDGALCAGDSPDEAPAPPAAAELEAAGQMRLPGVA